MIQNLKFIRVRRPTVIRGIRHQMGLAKDATCLLYGLNVFIQYV